MPSLKAFAAASALVGAIAVAGGASAQNLIVNGGFNNGDVDGPPGGFQFLNTGSNAINGWSILGGSVDWIRGYWQSADADGYSIDLNGGSAGILAQTINTVAGQTYDLSFSLSGNPDAFRGETRIAIIGAGGTTIGTSTYDLTAANSRANMLWATETYSFVATGATTEIRFTSGNPIPGSTNTSWGAALDNVSVVTAVPEPTTWALMILGFGSAGAMLRRRRAATA